MFGQVTLAIIAVLALNASALILPGQCPQESYPVVQNFSAGKYFGDWFLIERYDNFWQEGLDCNTITYSLNSNFSIGVLVQSRKNLNRSEYNSVEGYAWLSYPSQFPTGQWNMSFYGSPPDRVNYNILSTDYETYSVVWACENISTTQKSETFFVLSRERVLEPRPVEVDTIIDRYFNRTLIRKEDQDPQCYVEFPVVKQSQCSQF